MAVINPNMIPPVPPVHHAPGHPPLHPSDVPRTIHTFTPGSMNPVNLVDDMARLRVNTDHFTLASDQKKEGDAQAPIHYLGYTFFKADAIPGQKSTWSHADRSRMHLSQADLVRIVQKRAKKFPGAQQYQSLSKLKRTHVDQLIEELRQNDPRFEWTCVYAKEEEKPFKGKNSRRGDYETVSMDVVIMRKPMDLQYPKNPPMVQVGFDAPHKPKERTPINVDVPIIHDEPRQMNKDFDKGAQWAAPGLNHGQMPSMGNNNVHQAFPPHLQQQAPLPPQGPPVGGRPQIHQVPLPQGMPSGAHQQHQRQQSLQRPQQPQHPQQPQQPQHPQHPQQQQHQQPGMQNTARAVPGNGPAVEVLNHGTRGIPIGVDTHRHPPQHQEQGFNHSRSLFAQYINQHDGRETFPQMKAHPGGTPGGDMPRAPNVGAEPESEWGPETSSIGDDESILFDHDDDSSITDESVDEEAEPREKPQQPWRGSLFRRHSSKSQRQEPVYRTHYRKQPQHGRVKYPAGYIDVVPAESKNNTNRLAKVQHREVARPARDRPKIIQDDLTLAFDEKYRGVRARNDIRSRILDDREARVERREKMVDVRTQMLDDRLDEACYLNRRMSLREPGGIYSRRYYLQDGM